MHNTWKKLAAITAGLSLVASLAACGGSNSQQDAAGSADAASLTIGKPDGTISAENNNPYAVGGSAMQLGYGYVIYEPLGITNLVDTSKGVEPWLASKIDWSGDYKSVTLTARDNVKWSDGQAFTAKDIAFTFNLFIKYPAMDTSALQIESATAEGNKATITFKESAFVKQPKFLSRVMLPEHLWSSVGDPTAYKNDKPVGTGPYTLKQFSSESVTLTSRKDYWKGEPEVKTLYYVSYSDNTALANALGRGDADWAQAAIPNVESVYLSKDKEHFHYWNPAALGVDALFLNVTKKPFNNLAFRKALNMVVDRNKYVKIAQEGNAPVIKSVTGLPSPVGDAFITKDYKGQNFSVDVEGAKKVLTDAGYTYQGDKLIDPDGEPVTFEMSVPQGWSNYVTGISLIADDAKKIGVSPQLKTPDADSWTEAIGKGDFDAVLHWTDKLDTPYGIYSPIFDGKYYAPINDMASYNFGRYQNDKATAAFNTYANTTDDAEREKALSTIEQVFVEDVPAISVVGSPFTVEYSTRKFTGWPSDDNLYGNGDPVNVDALMVLTKLKAVK